MTLLRDGDPVAGTLFVTVNPDPADPRVNVLNPDGRTHVVSWYDSATGDLLFALEDLPMAGRAADDGDLNDVVFRLHFGPVGERQLFYGGGAEDGTFGIAIADDGGTLAGAELRLTDGAAGDRLEATRPLDADGDGLVDGTAIRIAEATGSNFALSGVGTIDQYEAILNSLRLVQDGEPTAGERSVSLVVTDADGNRSAPAPIRVTILDPVDDGGPGDDLLEGGAGFDAIAGRGGADLIHGGDGRDFLSGGDGADQLFGDGDDDFLSGGPGQDTLEGGPGGDRFIVGALGDGRDTILDFDAGQGDRLDLERLFAGSGLDPAADASSFLRFVPMDADGDAVADIGVIVDLDGAGGAHVPSQVATLLDPTGVAPGTPILEVTTFVASDGATA